MKATHAIDTDAADARDYMRRLGQAARESAVVVAEAATADKNAALDAVAQCLRDDEARIIEANAADLTAGKRAKLSDALLDRLALDAGRIAAMAEGCRQVAALPDPVGEVSGMAYRPSGIQVGRMRVPLGVIGIIYESRPNVTVDAAVLCLKAGNAVLLRGGSEAIHSNRAIAESLRAGLQQAQLPAAAAQLVETTDRAAVGEMLRMRECIDVIVPRARLRQVARHRAADETRHRRRLVRRISRRHSRGARGRRFATSHRAHQHLRLAPHRFHRHRKPCQRAQLLAPGGFQFGDGERLDAVRRRF